MTLAIKLNRFLVKPFQRLLILKDNKYWVENRAAREIVDKIHVQQKVRFIRKFEKSRARGFEKSVFIKKVHTRRSPSSVAAYIVFLNKKNRSGLSFNLLSKYF